MVDINPQRIKNLTESSSMKDGPVLYWMQRDKRVNDNWALLYAQKLAIEFNVPLIVCFHYFGKFSNSNLRQYHFLFQGLQETHQLLKSLNIELFLIKGTVKNNLIKFIQSANISTIVTDFSPLRNYRKRIKILSNSTKIPIYQVDAHNIVPVWVSSQKQEWAAYTLRPKIIKLLEEYLVEFPKIIKHPIRSSLIAPDIVLNDVLNELKIDHTIKQIGNIVPGELMALKILKKFMAQPINDYSQFSNNPNYDVLTNLSPYLHYGQISAQRVALELKKIDQIENKSVLEQVIIRRELAENFCYYNKNYDSFNGFPVWAKETLQDHWKDKREYLYNIEHFESADTHDPLWNASQIQMLKLGKIHSYMRMYWAKKILDWTTNPEDALQIAIDLNDKYELDGRDPNGYTGIAWSIGGVHDRAWFERPIYGKIRYMSYNGCKSKFDIDLYIKTMKKL